jgi:hypothetical protein
MVTNVLLSSLVGRFPFKSDADVPTLTVYSVEGWSLVDGVKIKVVFLFVHCTVPGISPEVDDR